MALYISPSRELLTELQPTLHSSSALPPLNSPFYSCYNRTVPVSHYYLSCTQALTFSFHVPLAFHLFLILYRKRFCVFSTLCLSLWHSGISASLVPIPCHLFLKIYTLHCVLSIKMPVKNKHAMVFLSSKTNACQNVPVTKLHLQAALPFPSSHNWLETLYVLRFVSFAPLA